MPRLRVPTLRARHAQRLGRSTAAAVAPGLQGSQFPGSTGGNVTNGSTYSEVVACPGANAIRVRILTVTATGTLNVKPCAPMAATAIDDQAQLADGTINPAKVQAYTTGTGTAAVAAATEQKVDVTLFGESFVLVEFVCSATGTVTFADVCQLVYS